MRALLTLLYLAACVVFLWCWYKAASSWFAYVFKRATDEDRASFRRHYFEYWIVGVAALAVAGLIGWGLDLLSG
jgi:hypothetical protein